MRAAGSDNTATTYNTQTLIGNGSTVTAGRGSNQNIGRLFSGSTAESVASFDVMSPALANATGWLGVCMRAAGSTIELESRVTGHATTSAFDGFSFLANTGTMTGRLYVYGYANALKEWINQRRQRRTASSGTPMAMTSSHSIKAPQRGSSEGVRASQVGSAWPDA
jgi:hypothetical protein